MAVAWRVKIGQCRHAERDAAVDRQTGLLCDG